MKNCGWKIIKALKCYFIADMLTTLFVYFTRNMMPLYFLTTSTLDTPTSGSLWKKKLSHKLPFLDALVDNDSNSFLTRVYRKKTFTVLLTNYFSLTPYSYKVGLIRTIGDRAYLRQSFENCSIFAAHTKLTRCN